MSPDVSVIVVTWNGRHYLEACLSAVEAQQDVTFETIIVDNGSEDGTADFVRERFPSVRVSRWRRNLGFAGGNNAGAATARGRYVAFLNNDTVAEPGWLSALRAGVDEGAGFALTTSRIVYMHDPSTIDSAGDGVLRWGGAFKRHHGAPAHLAERVAGSLWRLWRRLPDAAGRVRGARRIRRRLLRLARRRGPVVPRAASRLPLPLRRRCDRAASRKRDDGEGERVCGVPRSAKPGVDVLQERACVDCLRGRWRDT